MNFRPRDLLTNLLRSGIKTPLEPEDQIRLLFINSIMGVGLIALVIFAVRDWVDKNYVFSAVTAAISTIVIVLFFLIRVTKNFRLGLWFLPILMAIFYGYLVAVGGRGTSGSLWSMSYPLIAIFLLSYRRGAVFSLAYLACLIIFLFVPGLVPASGLDVDFKIRLLGTYSVIFVFVMEFEFIRVQAQLEIERARKALAQTTGELLAEKAQTDGILRNIQEGICLLDSGHLIAERYSDSLEQILDYSHLAGVSFVEYFRGKLPDRDVTAIADYLNMFFDAKVSHELLRQINPLESAHLATLPQKFKTLAFSFNLVELEQHHFVLVTVRDDTATAELNQRLQAEENRAERQMRHLFQILHVRPELLLQFLEDASDEIADINRLLRSNSEVGLIESFYQGIHAVKGNASLIGLSSFSERVHELESLVKDFRSVDHSWNDVLNLTVELAKIQAELDEIRALLEKMKSFQIGMTLSHEQTDLVVMTLERSIAKLSQECGLEVRLDLAEFEVQNLPSGHRKLIKDVLVQLVRNSFAHGFETPEERLEQKKNPTATVKICAHTAPDSIHLSYHDDGRGLDTQKIRAMAEKNGIALAGNLGTFNETNAVELIFQTGFSTLEAANLHAGRGVGLGLVKNRIESAKGTIHVFSVPSQGLSFDIRLPKG